MAPYSGVIVTNNCNDQPGAGMRQLYWYTCTLRWTPDSARQIVRFLCALAYVRACVRVRVLRAYVRTVERQTDIKLSEDLESSRRYFECASPLTDLVKFLRVGCDHNVTGVKRGRT